ncbi:hypothetical protein AAFF_G00132170 [Aldrovandia affinis]|uniref:Uncharacterized protein n=1 Tax=Aldrovandia affinis TaxID=143900 RepID=A0AAD7RQX8_9TELE|nr:hypothetical protein AAFF_G00132170 [Aldrovandia affinis]
MPGPSDLQGSGPHGWSSSWDRFIPLAVSYSRCDTLTKTPLAAAAADRQAPAGCVTYVLCVERDKESELSRDDAEEE